MKVLYMAMAVALSCVVPAHSMSMQELQTRAVLKCFMALVKVAMVMAPL